LASNYARLPAHDKKGDFYLGTRLAYWSGLHDIGIGDAKVHTTEHVLAALYGLQIDNCRIELTGPEPPVVDGSSKPFVDALLSAGFEQQSAPKNYLVIEETVEYVDEARGVHIVGLPLDDFRATIMIDYKNPALGSQHTGIFDMEKEFASEFAGARTFCFLSEVAELARQGLIKGGDIDNAIVIADCAMSQSELDELARHKFWRRVPDMQQMSSLSKNSRNLSRKINSRAAISMNERLVWSLTPLPFSVFCRTAILSF